MEWGLAPLAPVAIGLHGSVSSVPVTLSHGSGLTIGSVSSTGGSQHLLGDTETECLTDSRVQVASVHCSAPLPGDSGDLARLSASLRQNLCISHGLDNKLYLLSFVP